MSFVFASFGVNDTFTLSGIDPDFVANPSVSIAQLIGTTITAAFTNHTTQTGTFVDDPATGKGLVFQQVSAVPLPAGLPLLLGAFGVLGVIRRKRAAAKA